MPSPTIKKLQARVAELKTLNKQLKNTIKQLNANVKSLSEAQRRTELQNQAGLARAAAGAHGLRKPLHAIAIVQSELEDPARDKFCRKAASRIKRALTTTARGLDKLERLGLERSVPNRVGQARAAAHGGDNARDDQTGLPAAFPLPPAASRLRRRRQAMPAAARTPAPMIYILDADAASLDAILPPLQDAGYLVRTFASAIRFAGAYRPGREICIVASASALDMDAIELIEHLRATNLRLPPIIITGEGDRKTIRAVIRAGAAAFIEKPFTAAELAAEVLSKLSRIADRAPEPAAHPEPPKVASRRRKTTGKMEKTAPESDTRSDKISALPESIASRESVAARLATLSKREHQVLALVIEGHPSKNIAADLGVSQRTIENHRAAIMRKMGAKSLAQLVRLVLAKK